jgi:hypothetical protein
MAKRDTFGDLMEGVAAMKSHREGKVTLRSYKVEPAPLPEVDSSSSGTLERGCTALELYSPENYASTNERWKNGPKGGRNRIRRPLRLFFSYGNTPTRWHV